MRGCVSVAECGLYVCLHACVCWCVSVCMHVCVASVSVRVGAVFFQLQFTNYFVERRPKKA